MPSRGEVWLVDLGLVEKARPALPRPAFNRSLGLTSCGGNMTFSRTDPLTAVRARARWCGVLVSQRPEANGGSVSIVSSPHLPYRASVFVAQGVRGWRRTKGAGPGQNN